MRLVVEHVSGHHRAEPFAYVALGQPGSGRQLVRRSGALRRCGEQSGAVTDVDHVVEHRTGVDRQHVVRTCLHLLRIEFGFGGGHHQTPSLNWWNPIVRRSSSTDIREHHGNNDGRLGDMEGGVRRSSVVVGRQPDLARLRNIVHAAAAGTTGMRVPHRRRRHRQDTFVDRDRARRPPTRPHGSRRPGEPRCAVELRRHRRGSAIMVAHPGRSPTVALGLRPRPAAHPARMASD